MAIDKMQKRTYSIEPYNPEWVLKFNKIKVLLQKVFNSKALAIEHIGSTSIPTMSAKPVVDVLVVVEKIEPFTREREEMSKCGYENGDNYIAPETIIFFKTEDGDKKTENIHICTKGSPKAIQFVTTRDYLRAHPERAREYSKLKEKLNEKYPDDYPTYREAKKYFIDETERLTKDWVENNQKKF